VSALVVGAGGQLGRELVGTAPDGVRVTAADRSQLDVTDAEAVREWMVRSGATVVVNAAGYTAVDRAEAEREAAAAANAGGPATLARAAAAARARLVHVSTDFVFDGRQSTPYLPSADPNPLSVYGRTKLDGERAVLGEAGPSAVVVRTAWVYSAHGSNFVKTMLRAMRTRDELRVVADQVGSPTWARGLARAIWTATLRPEVRGILHWTDAGVASWYDFAVAIQEEALTAGLLAREVTIRPIRTEGYPTPATRPAYSVLDKEDTWRTLALTPPHWRVALRQMLEELVDA
jgi:dTDP-4-dehydrorhamnose reductase